MKATKRFLLTLAAILGMTGAWAQATEEVAVTKTANNNEWTLTMPASDVELQVEYYMPFDLTLADGSNAHGTVAFTVGDAAATQALKDDVVTVSVTPADGYTVKGVTAKTSSQVVVPMTNGENGWTFTMPEDNVAVTVTYTKDLQDTWIQDILDQTYTGKALTPAVVKDGKTTLTEDVDYTVAYENNVNAGTATVTVTGIGNYSGTASKTFTIAKADITPTAPVALTTLVYNTKAQPLIEAGQAEGGEMQYSLDGQSWSTNIPTAINAGDYTVNYRVVGDANHNDVAAQTLTVTIAQAELTSVTLAETSFVYNGQEQKPAVTVKDGETVLNEDVDYTLTFENDINAGTAKVTATGKGNYTGTQTKTYEIQKADITPTAPVAQTTLVYNTKAQPLIEAGQAEGGEMQYSLDGQSWSTNIPTATNAGDYTVNYRVVGDANHNDVAAQTLTVTIAQAKLTSVTLAETNFVYDGTAKEPAVTVKDGETTLTEDVDYTVAYSNNVEGGSQGVVTITGIGNYSGTVSKTFNIIASVLGTANAAIAVDVPEGLGQLTPETTGQATDLYYFLQSYLQNSPNPAYIKLRLASMGQYVISQPLTVLSAIAIEGDAEAIATIDATALGKNPFVLIDNNYTSGMLNEKGYCTNMYDITFKNFQLKGLKGQVFYANKQKYLIPYFTVDNCIFRMEGASNKTFFDFNGGGFVEQFTLTNSTLSGDGKTSWSNGGFFSTQSGPNMADTGAAGLKLVIKNNTFYNVAKGKTVSTLRQNSQTWMSFEVMHNVIVNSGKKGEFVKGLNAGQNKSAPNWLVQYNSFLWTEDNENFEDIGASEISGASNIPIAANVEGEIVFLNGKDGLAEGDFSQGECAQKTAKIGDPRWLSASLLSKLITPESLDDDKDLAKAINQGVQEGFVKFQLAENARYSVKQTIVADKGLVIKGKNVTIDVEHADALVLMGKTPTGGFMPKSSTETAAPALNRAAGVEYTDYYKFDELTLSGLKVNGLKNSIIYDNNVKYCVTDLTIDDCVMQLETEAVKNDALIAFQAGGVNNLTVRNSTFYGNNGAKYFVRYNNSARIDRFGFDKADDTWSFTYENNTFYKTVKSDGQWGNYSGIVGKNAQGIVTVKNNIWYDCDAQTMRRLLHSKKFSQFSSASQMENNTFIVDGEAVDQGDYGNGSDLTGDPGFKRPAEGDFTLSAYSEQFLQKTGDPRWYADGGHYNPVTGIEGVEAAKADDGAWYTIQGVRVDKPAKGLYIHNGRKVVIK